MISEERKKELLLLVADEFYRLLKRSKSVIKVHRYIVDSDILCCLDENDEWSYLDKYLSRAKENIIINRTYSKEESDLVDDIEITIQNHHSHQTKHFGEMQDIEITVNYDDDNYVEM